VIAVDGLKHIHLRMTQKVYEAYKRNGWPYDHFDTENCRAELEALQDEWGRVHKAKSEARSKKTREDFLKKLTLEQLRTGKKSAEQQNS
jgi:hypothetical protein